MRTYICARSAKIFGFLPDFWGFLGENVRMCVGLGELGGQCAQSVALSACATQLLEADLANKKYVHANSSSSVVRVP